MVAFAAPPRLDVALVKQAQVLLRLVPTVPRLVPRVVLRVFLIIHITGTNKAIVTVLVPTTTVVVLLPQGLFISSTPLGQITATGLAFPGASIAVTHVT